MEKIKNIDSKVMERSCPSCGKDNQGEPSISYAPDQWPLKKCTNCGMVYLEKAWSLDVLYDEFSWEKSVEVESERRDKVRGIERKISKQIRKLRNTFPRKNAAKLVMQYADKGNVLDVGSGSGYHLLQLSESYTPYGIEISTHAVNTGMPLISKRGGMIVNKDALSGLKYFSDNLFTGMIMRSFLEHEVLPKEVLIEAQRVLKPNGVVVIKVPNYSCINRVMRGAKWCGFRFPEHVNYFTPDSLKDILTDVGFKIKRFGLLDKTPTSDNMWLVAEKK